MLVGIQRDAVVIRQRGELVANAGQARRIVFRIAVELELEIARPGIFTDIGDAAGALDLVVETDGMPARNALEPLPSPKKLRKIFIAQIGRQTGIDPGNVLLDAVEEIHADRTQQRVQDRLVDFGRPEGGGERRDVFFRAGLDLSRNARGMSCKSSFESRTREIEIARNRQRTAQFQNGLLRRQVRALVEPFRRHQFGAGTDGSAPAFDLDLNAHEYLRRGVDHHGAKPERFCKRNRPFKKCDVPHGQT